MKNILFFLFIFSLVSCVDVSRPKQLEEIENCQSELKEAKDLWSTISFDSLKSVLKVSQIIESRIKEFYSGDTISIAFAEKMESFHSLQPQLLQIISTTVKMDTVFLERKIKLELLKNDIQKGAGSRASYDENIQFENEEVNGIINFVNYCDSSATSTLKTFDNLHIELEQFSIECENKFNTLQKP